VILAWGACLVGIAIGVLGCVMLAFDRTLARADATTPAPASQRASGSEPVPATPRPAPETAAPSLRTWALLVAGTSRETLSVLRRLAGGIDDAQVAKVRDALRSLSERFGALAGACPPAVDDDVVSHLRTAERGARNEADRLQGVVVVGSDRRAFLASLRTLRDAARAYANADPTADPADPADDGPGGSGGEREGATASHPASGIRPSFA
jgi:hypothetical protein